MTMGMYVHTYIYALRAFCTCMSVHECHSAGDHHHIHIVHAKLLQVLHHANDPLAVWADGYQDFGWQSLTFPGHDENPFGDPRLELADEPNYQFGAMLNFDNTARMRLELDEVDEGSDSFGTPYASEVGSALKASEAGYADTKIRTASEAGYVRKASEAGYAGIDLQASEAGYASTASDPVAASDEAAADMAGDTIESPSMIAKHQGPEGFATNFEVVLNASLAHARRFGKSESMILIPAFNEWTEQVSLLPRRSFFSFPPC